AGRQDVALLELLAGAACQHPADQHGSSDRAQGLPARQKALGRGRLGHCGTGPVLLEPASPAVAGAEICALVRKRGSLAEPTMLWPFNHFRKPPLAPRGTIDAIYGMI